MKKQETITKKNSKHNAGKSQPQKVESTDNLVSNAAMEESWEDNYGFGDFSYRMPRDFEN